MATLTQNKQLGLVELANRTNDRAIMAISEVLDEILEYIQDAVWTQANQMTSHKHSRRLQLPSGSWRIINDGVGQEASRTKPVVEGIGMLESYARMDKALVDMAPESDAFRSSEEVAFIEGLGQTFADAFIYGTEAGTPEQFDGLATRLNALSQENVIDGGGSGGDTTSIIVIQWAPNKVHFIYPKGSPTMGVNRRDLGEQTIPGVTANTWLQAYVTHFAMYVGLAVEDDRCLGRVANIEAAGAANIFDPDDLIKLLNKMPSRGGNARIYVNETIMTQMDIQAKDKTNVYYSSGEVFGRPTTLFRGFPIRQVDAIVNTETAVA